MAAKDRPDTRGGESDAHRGQLALDPPISPHGVLSRQPEDDLDSAGGNVRSPRAGGVGPPTSDQIPVPPEQGLGLDEKPAPMPAAEEPTQPSKERPVAGSQRRTGYLAAQHHCCLPSPPEITRMPPSPSASEPSASMPIAAALMLLLMSSPRFHVVLPGVLERLLRPFLR